MGGSQLTQLKSTLRASGLSRTSSPKDAKKRSKQRKELSATSQAHRSTKLDDIGKDFNQFDLRQEKRKFDVVTRQGKLEQGKKGAPTKSRTAGLELRKKTLLPMLQQRTHSSSFVDRRFGETSTTLTPEEKALERFTAERQSRLGASKKSRFNLGDSDDDGEGEGEGGLTHGGQKLGFGDEEELEAGGWGGLGAAVEGGASEGNREPLLRRRMAEVKSQEQDDDQPDRKRTKAEIMDEVMLKSKTHKFERQRLRSADDETRHALDAELKELRGLLGGSGRMPRPKEAQAPAAEQGIDGEEEEEEDSGGDEEEDEDEDDEEGEGDSDEEGSTYELNDEELEAALAAAGKPGVDRELLKKLIGGCSSDEDEDDKPAAPRNAFGSSAPAPIFELEEAPRPAPAVEEKSADPYDQYVRLLALEPRAKPTDRLKTPLELAQQEAEELRKAEEGRRKRMRGEAESDDEEEGGKGKKKGKKERRVAQGDDLDDDFFDEEGSGSEGEEEEGLGRGLEGGFGAQVIEASGDDEEESGSDEEGSDDEEEEDLAAGFEDDSDDEVDPSAADPLVAPLSAAPATASRQWGGQDVKPELPFTFPCPSTHEEFVKLLRSAGIREQGTETATVVKRIRTLYHPGLAQGNGEKLQTFHSVLLDHVLHLASSPLPTTYSTINSLLPHLLTLSHAYPLQIAPHYLAKLSLMQKALVHQLSTLGPLDPAARTFPGAPELTLLRLVGMVWSTSDLSHPVGAAALLLIGQYLSQSRVRSLADIASGLFLCTVASQYEQESKRIVPECLAFLANSLLLLLPSGLSAKAIPGGFPVPDVGREELKGLKLRSSSKDSSALESLEPSKRVDFLASLSGQKKTKYQQAQSKVDLVDAALKLVKSEAERQVGASEASVEMFKPIEVILSKVMLKGVPTSTKTSITTLLVSLRRMLSLSLATRKPLTLQQHRAIPIATYIPKFDEGYNPTRRFDPDTERAEQSKIKALYKKEKKGAIRELRKDNKFLAGEEVKRKAEADATYNKKIAKIMGSLQDERAEEKAHERAKEKGKKQDKARASRK